MQNTELNEASSARETYLIEVTLSLSHRLAPPEILESIQELRVHIDAMAAAHEELGVEADAAMRLSSLLEQLEGR